MNRLRELDNELVKLTQDIYLWIFDRTGIYVGTVSAIVYALGKVAWISTRVRSLDVVDAFFLALVLAFFTMKWRLQHCGTKAAYNLVADHWRASPFRKIFWLIIVIVFPNVIVMEIARGNPLAGWCGLADMISVVVVWQYLLVVQIRDREPPEKKFWEPATESSR